MTMADDELKRQLKIKAHSVKRLAKELGLYEKEQEKEQERVDSMKANGADSHDVKHAENVLAEAAMMLPDTRQRLESALQDLVAFVAKVEVETAETEELSIAQETIQQTAVPAAA